MKVINDLEEEFYSFEQLCVHDKFFNYLEVGIATVDYEYFKKNNGEVYLSINNKEIFLPLKEAQEVVKKIEETIKLCKLAG